GLVEDQELGVAEQRRGEAKPLAHAERVGLHPPLGFAAQLDQLEHFFDPRKREPGCERERTQVVATAAAGGEVVRFEYRSDPGEPAAGVPGRGGESGAPPLPSAPPAPGAAAASSSCRRRWGRESRSPCPARVRT